MRALLTRTLPLACAAALLLTAPAGALAAPSGLSALRLSGSRVTGALHRSSMPVTLVLAPRDRAALEHAHGLTPAAFQTRFAPSTTTVDAVRSWAAKHGLNVEAVSSNRLLVRVRGSAAQVGKAFGTRLQTFSAGGRSYFAPATAATLPGALSAQTVAVLGLSDLGRVGVDHRVQSSQLPSSLNYPAAYGPRDFWSLYDAPSAATGSGQRVAVIAEGDLTQPRRDLVSFEDKFALPHVTWNQIQVGAPSSDTSGSDEWDLDTQYSTGFAPDVTQLDVYDGPSLSNDDILREINRWVTDDASSQASFSAGECELLAYATGFTDGLDTVLAEAAAQGQTLFASSGDTGVFCAAVVGVNGVPAGIPSVEYPASSPYAIGVGGTTVLGPGPSEIGWYAGGGGSSYFETTPAWQQNAGGSFLGVRRGVPDVALDADPESGYRVIVAGQESVIGGTSASAPSWQGIWARAQSAHGGTLGFAGPAIYGIEPASAFHDITLGGNPAPATPGWDYVTGRGTPDIAAFVSGA